MTAPSLLDRITPVLLTHDEEPNIGGALSHLRWAKDIVVVDSGSADRTLDILRADPRVRVFARPFDTHASQWRFAVMETGVASDWILRLDADYRVSDALIAELRDLRPAPDVAAYEISFDYAIFGGALRTSLYPPNTVLLRSGCFSVYDRGHTEAWRVHGRIERLAGRIVHDDRKSTARFVSAQIRYMSREVERLDADPHSLKSRLRDHPPLMPIAAFVYAYFVKGLFLDGRAGLAYALQRLIAESILALMALEKRLSPDVAPSTRDGARDDDAR
ncbi:glycosyltransferase family 2 protein [Methylosinus sp. H3A]|uniref:glycosyltransferase family 2 protein n=1 Tax=Methylosinus sp. H3A TaxID=2785786 RepID=UPI0018C27AA8|nr:glycosyltransferase family 2 protein [Methylosinus sp. H3A]MBG0811732.1 glycosyltransferase family 2 protein [Methylosinus sp. H3A]